MNRRQLLTGLSALPLAIIVPELLLPKRTYFLPPFAGGWTDWPTYRIPLHVVVIRHPSETDAEFVARAAIKEGRWRDWHANVQRLGVT